MSETPLEALAQELCDVFVGWRLGQDEDVLRGFGEGSLLIDLCTAECWVDGEPVPRLFIAEELARRLTEAASHGVREARLEAVFATRAPGLKGPRTTTLELGCACVVRHAAGESRGQARRGVGTPLP